MTLIISILNDNSISRHCPIAHLIPRDPTAFTFSNSSSHTAGGYSTDLKFWWHINWPEQVQARAAKARTNEMISINALEYAAIIINLVATTSTILASPSDQDPYPTVLYFTDNVTLEAWIRKGA